MIIKKVNIIAFGALKNKVVNFDKGLNVIYGENESGKSTIEAFIKVWLYGFSTSRVKDLRANERVRYAPSSGETMRGELFVEFEDKEYIIIRTFGKTKKDDTSKVINALTGEDASYITYDEPGKYFLSINRSTFTKTLFIGQLDVGVKKDKEEEILDKISTMLGVGEGDITIDKAFNKLEVYKKSLNNVRKNGLLDNLKNRYNELREESYEGYTLSEHNIQNEERLISLKHEKKSVNNELQNLDIYKKYLKKVKLQKEYEEISEYLKKQEELKRKGKYIEDSLTCYNETITAELINDIKEEHSLYLRLLDLRNEDNYKLNGKKEKLEALKEPIKSCEYIGALGDDLSQNLMKLKIEQIALKEKVDINNKIDFEINSLNNKSEEIKNNIGSAIKLQSVRDEVAEQLRKYEEGLKELKYIFEIQENSNKSNNIFKIISGIIAMLSIVGAIIINNSGSKLILIIVAIVSIISLLSIEKIKGLSKSGRVKLLKNEINKIEKKLVYYNKIVEVQDFGQLIKKLRLYDEYILTIEKINNKIEEKIAQKELLSLDEGREKYLINEKRIDEYRKVSGIETLDELMKEVNYYEQTRKNFSTLELDVKNSEEAILRVEEQLGLRESRIREKLKTIGLEDVELLDLGTKLLEIKEKILQREEVKRSLQSIEETYAVLSKGKNIDSIKNELKDIINVSFKYSYKTEEEIDEAVKEKSNRLIWVEKEIKDVENEISNRFKGKRRLPEIEEELQDVEGRIKENEKNLRASIIASDMLKEANDEIRQSFGPLLNQKVIKTFSDFTDGKYSEAMVSDKYEMKVVKDGEMLSAELLSNGANDQLYLALRLAFI
ncbi:MAG: AAA family ATPase, partial [Cetobacterium sp.]